MYHETYTVYGCAEINERVSECVGIERYVKNHYFKIFIYLFISLLLFFLFNQIQDRFSVFSFHFVSGAFFDEIKIAINQNTQLVLIIKNK